MRADRLKTLRKTRGYTQEEFAALIEASQSLVGRWEAEKVVPSAEYITKMAIALGVTSDYLLGLVDTPHGEITYEDLSEEEQRLINFARSGLLAEAMKALASLAEDADK